MSSPDEQDFPGHLLHQAALWDNADLLLDLLNGELISLINSQDSWGRTPLHAAATTDNSKCLEILLKAGANPNVSSGAQDNFKTPLHVSAEHGFMSNIRLLIEHGADAFAAEGHGWTPIDLAERGGHGASFEFLRQAANSKEESRENLHCALREAAANGDFETISNLLKDLGPVEVQCIINMTIDMTPDGKSTLLFKACESGNKPLVQLLIEHGADGRLHPVTKYSPLYIAAYYGHKEIVSILLKKFPLLVQVPTVEKWLPLHACCIHGHTGVLDLLLKFEYPSDILRTFHDPQSGLTYEMAFDINMKDVSDQNALYIACQMGNQRLVETLLKYRVEGRKPGELTESVKASPIQSPESPTDKSKNTTSPNKKRLSEGIQGILNKLSIATNQNLVPGARKEHLICPVDVNAYCEEYQTPLHVAVKKKHHVIAAMLLATKADPNLPILPVPSNVVNGPYEEKSRVHKRSSAESSSSLVEACLHRDLGMIELLLKYGARDNDCKALEIVAKDDVIVGKILSLRAHLDAENKVNTTYLTESVLKQQKKIMLSASVLPTSAVTINWHSQRLDRVLEQWLVSAALKINPRLRLCPRNQTLTLHAITRLDLSANTLERIPTVIFSMCSLKYLNLSQNKIERLQFPDEIMSPGLEELLVQENRFEVVPSELFTKFPSLTSLNLSNNKIQAMPSCMWSAPMLQELNLSLNLLTDLPSLPSANGGGGGGGAASSHYGGFDPSVLDSLPYIPVITPLSPDSSEPTSPDFVMVDFEKNRDKFCMDKNLKQMKSESGNHGTVLVHHSLWRDNIKVLSNSESTERTVFGVQESSLLSLNLSHNSFHKVPKVLSCLGLNIQRLNLSFNNLKALGHITDYPNCLRQLDLSSNRIEKWFYNSSEKSSNRLQCWNCKPADDIVMQEGCPHKRHVRLESLKTLVISGNLLKMILVSADDYNEMTMDGGDGRKATAFTIRNLWFPNLTMLDLSDNMLKEVTPRIAELTNLSVLNLSGNSDITDLPPEMGLLSRMWNLNTTRCNLQEPLKSMIESKRCKTMDVIGYLKSVLEDAKTYSRMKLMVVGIQGIGKTSLLGQLRQEGSQKYAQQDHWAKRMGTASRMSPKGKTISTVGVDIGCWVLDYRGGRSSGFTCGPVTFRTWDFGGQKEYYATHLYFLSRRSLYLVVWNICDGEKGLNEIVQWLVNIQARAPNSPVIIVGTHFDLVSEKFPPGYLDYLQQKIRDRFICISDPEKRGLPRVVHSVEVSCKTRHNIRHLCNLIYETVFSIKTTTGKRLLDQKIPSKYVHLEEIVAYLATERRSRGLDPVLNEIEFKSQVSLWLEKGFGLTFRDDAEIMQACSFLHENGVLLHYEDSTLRDLYFLDPQWLCDMLAHVVTVREINPFAKYGIMKVDDLKHLFKGQSNDTRDYVLSLLSKFELAVPWDHIHLLIPSLLPSFEQMKIGQNEVRVKIPVRSRGWALKNRPHRMSRNFSEDISKSTEAVTSPTNSQKVTFSKLNEERVDFGTEADRVPSFVIQRGKVTPLNRFLLLSYFPSGFWPRLISRILADDRIVEIVRNYFNVPPPSEITPEVVQVLDQRAEWCCWQSGMELTYGELLLLRLKEVTGEKPFSFMLRRDDGALCESEISDTHTLSNELTLFREDDSEQVWDVVDLNETGLLEIHLPAFSITVNSQCDSDEDDPKGVEMKQFLLEPSVESIAKLLALIVDHVDTLLEDWYPSIGTRFVHTSEGKYLVTRLIPCPKCFPTEDLLPSAAMDLRSETTGGGGSNQSPQRSSRTNEFFRNFSFGFSSTKSPRMSSDSGVGHSPTNTRVSSVDSNSDVKEATEDSGGGGGGSTQNFTSNVKTRVGPGIISPVESAKFSSGGSGGGGGGDSGNFSGLNFFLKASPGLTGFAKRNVSMYSWSVEYCILHSQKYAELQSAEAAAGGGSARLSPVQRQLSVKCPKHGDILLEDICPDILFLDLNSRYLLQKGCIQRGNLLGRGAFGFVFSGKLVPKYDSKMLEIAIKMFQPIDPGHQNPEAQAAYKAAKSKWFRAPAQSACRAYVAARGEVRVLYWVSHPNIVPFVGLCQSPLSIVMPRAPKGALDSVLSDYRRCGDKVSSETLRATILQVAKALEYLHSHRIIYRDLKSENVLVWNFPPPFTEAIDRDKVDVKLADYGISRSSFPTGSKGFGGTEGFMAPEIIRYNGEEEYTEKVDIFSFGMLMYEMVSQKQPFDGCENVKESILEGIRPCLTKRDCEVYPLYILDLMVVCWSHIPKDRPTASQIVTIATGPEFTFLRDVVSLGNVTNVVAALGIQYGGDREIWASCSTGGIYCLKIKSTTTFESCLCFEFISGVVTAMCQINENVWMGDTLGKIHVLRISDYNKSLECDLESQVGYCSAVVSIRNLESVIAVAVTTGRLFLCDRNTVQLLSELGKSTVIHCLNSRIGADGNIELWAGERAGQMSIFSIKDGTVVSQEIINHYEPTIEAVEVLLMDAHEGNDMLFSYVYPGSVIYGWDCDKREMVARLDVGKLLPVRESVEDELNSKPLQVTVLKSTISEVYIGTNWGFVFVAETKYLRPIASFRPFTEDVRSFWIFRQMQTFSTMINLSSAAGGGGGGGNVSADAGDSEAGTVKASGSVGSQVMMKMEVTEDGSKTDDSRGGSPVPPNATGSFKNLNCAVTNSQLVIGIGKGFSNLINKNAGFPAVKSEVKQRRRAFALLWHVKGSWE